MPSPLARYVELWRVPGAVRFVAFGFLARLPVGTVGLSTLLYLRELTGSIAFAGSAVGAQLVAAAATAPLAGRIIDARGPRAVLLVTALICPLAMLTILFAAALGLSRSAIVTATVVMGAFQPPIIVVSRALWRHRLPDEDRRRTAFAVDTVLLEVSYTIGPALVAAIVAVRNARTALALACVFVALSVPLLLASGGLSWWQSERGSERHWLGPLRHRALLSIYGTTFLLSLLFGSLEVGYPGFAIAAGTPAWGPLLIAINSIASAMGGILYGALHLSMSPARQLPRLLAVLAIPVAVHTIITSTWGMAPWAFVAGIMIAPAMTVVTLLVSRHAPPAYATEAFTWSATAIVTGIGIGMALAGLLVEQIAPWAAFAVAAVAALSAAIVARLTLGRAQ